MTPADRLADYVEVVWNRGRVADLSSFVHPEVVFGSADPALTSRGLAAAQAAVRRALAPFDEYQLTVEQLVAQASVVAWRWTVRARLRSIAALGGQLRVLAATMDELRWVGFSGASFTTFLDDRIAEEWTESNPFFLARQMGAVA